MYKGSQEMEPFLYSNVMTYDFFRSIFKRTCVLLSGQLGFCTEKFIVGYWILDSWEEIFHFA